MFAACAYSLYLQTLSLSAVESHTKWSASQTGTHAANAQGIKYVRFTLTERLKRMKSYKTFNNTEASTLSSLHVKGIVQNLKTEGHYQTICLLFRL